MDRAEAAEQTSTGGKSDEVVEAKAMRQRGGKKGSEGDRACAPALSEPPAAAEPAYRSLQAPISSATISLYLSAVRIEGT